MRLTIIYISILSFILSVDVISQVGGTTPTVMTDNEFNKILEQTNFSVDYITHREPSIRTCKGDFNNDGIMDFIVTGLHTAANNKGFIKIYYGQKNANPILAYTEDNFKIAGNGDIDCVRLDDGSFLVAVQGGNQGNWSEPFTANIYKIKVENGDISFESISSADHPTHIGDTVFIKAKKTLTVVEANEGDEIQYELESGRIVHIKLLKCKSEIIFSSCNLPGKGSSSDASAYKMELLMDIDGQTINMTKYVPCQESFYEPYNINGLRIWFDALKNLNQFYNENHGECLPKKQIRLAMHDATLPICPEELENWYDLPNDFLNVKTCYRGEDTWLGTFYGADLHGGLDITMPANTPLYAPFSLNDNYYFNRLTWGDNNNRWRAIKDWENGDKWTIQTHHLDELLIPERQEVTKGTHYANSGGTYYGMHTHTHFVFKVKQPGFDEFYIDPWIIFWQISEMKKENSGELKAKINPFSPGMTGESLNFDGTSSHSGLNTIDIKYYWTFGDGGVSFLKNPSHTFQTPGIYPVTLTISDGENYSSATQHITINGVKTFYPEMKMIQNNNLSFNVRRNWEMDTYNIKSNTTPNTIDFLLSQRDGTVGISQAVALQVINSDVLILDSLLQKIEILYEDGDDWLEIDTNEAVVDGKLVINISPKISSLNADKNTAHIIISNDNFINSPVFVRVNVNVTQPIDKTIYIIDDQDNNCVKSNYSWLTMKFNANLGLLWSRCHGESFLLFANNEDDGVVRYTPNLKQGRYRVSLLSPLYNQSKITSKMDGFFINIKHSNGVDKVWVAPSTSTVVGEFNFSPDTGYVEIISKGSKGLIVADAVMFERL
jgi:PKD repeat protein